MMTDDDNEVSYLHSERTRLHWAVFRGEIEQLQIFIQNGEDLNTQDVVGNSPLHYLPSHNSEIVETLVKHGANVNFKNKYGRTPLHALVSNKDACLKDARLKSVKVLLEKGVNVNSQDCRGSTPLHDLVQCILHNDWHPSDNDICDLLLAHGANVQLQDLNGSTSLHLAGSKESIFTVKLLESTSGKSAVNIPDKSGDYPLHTAARKISFTMFMLLLDNGAIINCKNKYGRTPLHDLMFNKDPNLKDARLKSVKMLLEKGANVNSQDCKGSTPLHDLVRCILYNDWHPTDDDICDLLLAHGANVRLQDSNGSTSLHLAGSKESIFTVKLLESTSGKSAVNIPDKSGDYPLHTAARKISFTMFTLLLDNGAIINCKNKYGRTPLHDLMFNKDPNLKDARLKSVKMLLEQWANVNAQDYRGSTPLHDLVRCSDWQTSDDGIYDLLIGYGANVQLQDVDGCTPLHLAVGARSVLTARLLESNSGKSTVNIPDQSGNYPLHTATRKLSLKMLKLLLDNGARINCKNGKGQTALHLSSIYTEMFRNVQFTTKSVVELLLERGAEVNSQDKKGRTSLDHAAKRCVKYRSKRQYRRSSLHQHIPILLDWGASFSARSASWKSRIDYSPFFDDQMKYEIRKTCWALPPNITKQVSPVHEFQSYEKDCRTELNKMKAERHGNISLYDVFQQQFDPYFLSNKGLLLKLRSTNLKDDYPYYASLLTATYHRSKDRVKLFDSVSTILQTPLPLEMMRYILSFVDNDSLRNVIKAKEIL